MSTIVVGIIEWEPAVALDNLVYRGVSFLEAATIFESQHVQYFTHRNEKRAVGPSTQGNILTVAYKWNSANPSAERLHILRAWHATEAEQAHLGR